MSADVRAIDVAALKRANPIEEVVAGYGIALRPGGRALVGRCPFHEDGGRPNLHVYRGYGAAPGSWYCFRCALGGDVLTFVMRREGLGFAEACARLGARATARPLAADAARPPAPLPPPAPPRRRDGLTLEEQVVMNTAVAVYQHSLWRNPEALAYLHARGVPDRVIRGCALGYADGQSLERFLRRQSWLDTAERLGLLRRPDGDDGRGHHELLAGRIVVPEIRGGGCVWFIGRRVPSGRGEVGSRPKYLSLPGERPVLGLERVLGRRHAFLVEGVFGWLTALAWNLPACSPCGTHLPPDRLSFLGRARTVYGLLDPDPAGHAAAARFGEQLGDRWRPLWLPDGRELDDLAVHPDGAARFFELLGAVRSAHEKENTHA